MAKKETTDWKHQVARAERKSRLARMKGSDGHKKKIESHSIWKKVTLALVAVVLVLGLLVWLISSTGLVTRYATAMTVGGRKVTAADFNMVLGNMTASEQYGLAFTEEFQEILDQASQMSAGKTIREDFINQLIPSIVFMSAALNEIEQGIFQLTDEQAAAIDRTAKSLEEQFTDMALTSGRSVSSLVKLYYGPGVSLRMVERDLRNSMLINYYQEFIREKADQSDQAVEAFYEEHKDSLDLYSYQTYVFKVETAEGATAEEKADALEDLFETVELALGDLEEFSFLETVLKYVSEEEAEAINKNPDSLTVKKARTGSIASAILDFLKAEDRKAGDAKVIKGTNQVTLVQFTGRMRDDFKPYSVRHILIANSDGQEELTDEELEKKARDILAEFMQGDRSEASFVKLVVKHSVDPGSKAAGGLYSDVASGTMVREFEQWSTEEGRKKGDTGLVKTTHGWHIMYFEGLGEELELPGKIRDLLMDAHLNEWIQAVSEEAEVVRHSFGMKFVGKTGFFDALFGAAPTEPDQTVPQLTPAG
ncbi:MAG: peptidylprolyl isomerase [Saccharofermentanales bacterium]